MDIVGPGKLARASAQAALNSSLSFSTVRWKHGQEPTLVCSASLIAHLVENPPAMQETLV